MTDIREIPRLTHPCGDCLYQDICGHCETIMALAPEYPLDVSIKCEMKEFSELDLAETCPGLANDLAETCDPLEEPAPEPGEARRCVTCGAEIEKKRTGRKLYCRACARARVNEQARERRAQDRRARKRPEPEPAPKPALELFSTGHPGDYAKAQVAETKRMLAEYGTCDLAEIRKIEEERSETNGRQN